MHRNVANQCDQGLAALIMDLKQRGLLDRTLILCTGELAAHPQWEMGQNGSVLRRGETTTTWDSLCGWRGGGIKGGTIYGATDDFGFCAVENRTSIHDLHATMLHLLGFDHERFTYRYAGRDFRLTDVHGRVVPDILA